MVARLRRNTQNLKDPACYLFPRENGCNPGSHFPAARRAEAQRFLGYHGYAFRRSAAQQWADAVNRGALLAVPVLLLAGFSSRLRRGKHRS
jgi:hypothetical protein